MGCVRLFCRRLALFSPLISLACSSAISTPADDVDMGMSVAQDERQITPEQTCNRLDDDNDGAIDEGIAIAVPCDTNLCGPGTTACNPGFWPQSHLRTGHGKWSRLAGTLQPNR